MILARGTTVVVASHNAGKVRELRKLLAQFGIVTKGAAELGLAEPDETGATFKENAVIKAVAAAEATGLPALADDSGLSVEALNGAPGIYSARWAGPNKDFSAGIARVQRELEAIGAGDYAAKFVCALAFAEPHGRTEIFEGEVHGYLRFPPRGDKGFGYDPIFVPDGLYNTFGEMEPEQKRAMSHRARAFEKFKTQVGLLKLHES
ncbi:MAG TPA: RdgB/HAM1 family non-canonical purine NTP pyrophosphatase [Rhizomicrobium sp.]|jgi:XTP/dITP diphosphohydrolase|nr:RdgB/HAM1 family non-canonical purine NTP pyrophosphatase [Rhizomicrobium sp.]